MFGQSDNTQGSDQSGGQPTDFAAAVNDLTTPNATTPPTPAAWGHPGGPIQDGNSTPSEPAAQTDGTTPPAPSGDPVPIPHVDQADPSTDASLNQLIELKQKALNELNPLVEHLDQNYEEKFNTIMMMIQASDDQSLIQSAYETAQKITDEKARAQALLDVVNEINYFTQQSVQ